MKINKAWTLLDRPWIYFHATYRPGVNVGFNVAYFKGWPPSGDLPFDDDGMAREFCIGVHLMGFGLDFSITGKVPQR